MNLYSQLSNDFTNSTEVYQYIMYNYKIQTNHRCQYLISANNIEVNTIKTIKILVNIHDSLKFGNAKENFIYNTSDNAFQGVWNNILFEVDWENYTIYIETDNIDKAYLFALNVPLSLLISYDNKLVLHCSCAYDNESVFGFSGCKGVGKSTLCSLFALNNRGVFSDDTICVDVNSMRIFSNYMVEKYTAETMNVLKRLSPNSTKHLSVYNQKYIKKLEYSGGPKDLENLYINYLFRGDAFAKTKILNTNAKVELFKNNIVGYRYSNNKLKSKIDNNIRKIFDNFDLQSSILYVPFCELSKTQQLMCKLESFVLIK